MKKIRKKAAYFIGLDVGGSSIKTAIVSSGGDVVWEDGVETEAKHGPKTIKRNLVKAVREAIRKSKEGKWAICGIGVGSAGIVDDRGNVYHPPQFPGWKKENVSGLLSRATGLPVWVENDANVAAIAEAQFGAGRKISDFVLMTLGTGVGGGIIQNGELVKGSAFAAGEIGHILVFPEGEKCHCGGRGCLEHYVGISAINRMAKEKMTAGPANSILCEKTGNDPARLSPRLIYEAAREGDVDAKAVLRRVGEIVGYAAVTLFNVLNMQAIILAGGVSEAGAFITGPMRQVVEQNAHRSPLMKLKILPAVLGKRTGVLGAAALAMRHSRKD